MKCDELEQVENPIEWGLYYEKAEVDAAIAELKAELDEKEKDIAYWREEYDKETKLTDSLNAEIESLKASHYAESVDAGMRERRLRRALWLARAERAEAEHAHWATIWFCDTTANLNINKSSVSQEPYKSNTFRNASEWRNTWYDIASKCRAKAEEYK